MPDIETPGVELRPLGAGDLIDRAIRLYRRNFWTFVQIAAPPVILASMVSIAWSYLGRTIFSIGAENDFGYIAFLFLGGIVILFGEVVLILMVAGGASRDLVGHLLHKSPLSLKETYKMIWSRLSSLFLVSFIVAVFLIVAFFIIYQVASIGLVAALLGGGLLATISPTLGVIVGVVVGLASSIAGIYLYCYLASFFIYTPSIMMVEGTPIAAAIGRNFSLTKGRAKPLAALVTFMFFATQSAMLLFYMPLLWYAFWYDIDIMSFDPDAVPFWYSVSTQLIYQMSIILLLPVLMLGMGLLYVDERVRHEGYDIELMAARQLGEIPALPQNYVNPLQPALAGPGRPPAGLSRPRHQSGINPLGLS